MPYDTTEYAFCSGASHMGHSHFSAHTAHFLSKESSPSPHSHRHVSYPDCWVRALTMSPSRGNHGTQTRHGCISVPPTSEVEPNDPKDDEQDRHDLWPIERLTKAESAEKGGEDHAHAAPRCVCDTQWHLAHNQWEDGEASNVASKDTQVPT